MDIDEVRALSDDELRLFWTRVRLSPVSTGVGLALIGVNRGYDVKLFVPEGFAEEKCILMRGFANRAREAYFAREIRQRLAGTKTEGDRWTATTW